MFLLIQMLLELLSACSMTMYRCQIHIKHQNHARARSVVPDTPMEEFRQINGSTDTAIKQSKLSAVMQRNAACLLTNAAVQYRQHAAMEAASKQILGRLPMLQGSSALPAIRLCY